MTSKRDPRSLLPLTPAMFHVLVALADGQTHGYAIMKEVEELTSAPPGSAPAPFTASSSACSATASSANPGAPMAPGGNRTS